MEHNMMSPFAPKGEVAQWRAIYRLFQNAEVGATVTYQVMADVLALHPVKDRARIQAAARQAARKFLQVDDRAVEVIPNEGYRLASAERQIPLAGAQVERAARVLDKGKDLTVHVRLDELSPEGRNIVQAMSLGFTQVAEYARQMTRRMEDHENRLSDVEAELQRLREDRG
jgi:hypothetical protein